jgi:hypothetical protein
MGKVLFENFLKNLAVRAKRQWQWSENLVHGF